MKIRRGAKGSKEGAVRARAGTVKKKMKRSLPHKKTKLNGGNKRMPGKISHKKTSLVRKDPTKRTSVRVKSPKSFLHKMLTAEGWKRLMMGKSSKK